MTATITITFVQIQPSIQPLHGSSSSSSSSFPSTFIPLSPTSRFQQLGAQLGNSGSAMLASSAAASPTSSRAAAASSFTPVASTANPTASIQNGPAGGSALPVPSLGAARRPPVADLLDLAFAAPPSSRPPRMRPPKRPLPPVQEPALIPAGRSPSCGGGPHGVPLHTPFLDDFSGVAWNSRGWLAADLTRYTFKSAAIQRFLGKHDFVFVIDTHGTAGKHFAQPPPPGCRVFWCAGTAARGGLALIIKDSFLQKFHEPQWEILVPGRLAVLRLRGPRGGLNLLPCYFPTGTRQVIPAEFGGGSRDPPVPSRDQEVTDPSIREQRLEMMRIARQHIQPHEALSVLAGDFNFVECHEDRVCKTSGLFTGGSDHLEARSWRAVMQGSLAEMHQAEYTHDGGVSRGRLDRVYTDMHVTDQLDKAPFCTPLEWQGRVSDHRPISFGRRSSGHDRPFSIPEYLIHKPEWATRVAARYCTEQGRQAVDSSSCSGMRSLCLLKTCMLEVSRAMKSEQLQRAEQPDSMEGRLGLLMSSLRRLEVHGSLNWSRLAVQLPDLAGKVCLAAWTRSPHKVLSDIREEVVLAAKAGVRKDIEDLQRDLPELEQQEADRRRGQIMRKLVKLVPGRGNTVTAVQLADGTISSAPLEVAAAIKEHWAEVFRARPTEPSAMEAAFARDEADPNGMAAALRRFPARAWRVQPADIRRAIASACRSAVGPDGVPYSAWKALGPLSLEVLASAARSLEDASCANLIEEAFPLDGEVSAFNAALLICIPKKIVHLSPEGTPYHLPSQLRPLTIVNTDNRLLASAARYRYESAISSAIGSSQRGFIPGRSMLKNVLEVDTRLRTACACSGAAGAVFFDFEAAFPTLSHSYLHHLLERLRLPACVRQFVRSLYHGHGCRVAQSGTLSEPFPIRAGIRQGCPLSPLLFALAVEPLLRELARAAPTALIRAYADDIAAVSEDISGMLGSMAPVFRTFASAAGLHLNLSKTVAVPTDAAYEDAVRQCLRDRLGWGAVPVRRSAEYLGFMLGPGAGQDRWEKPFTKMRERAALWATAALGHYWATMAYNTFIASILGFRLQFEPLPDHWPRVEAELLRKLFPGPGNWASPADLRTQRRELGLPAEICDMQHVSLAARFRVAHREALAEGGLEIRRMVRRIERSYREASDPDAVLRTGRLRTWLLSQSFAAQVAAACDELEGRGITISSVEDFLRKGMPMPLTQACARRVKRGLQGAVRRRLAEMGRPRWERRLRARLDRYRLPLLPGHRAARALRVMAVLKGRVAPRVQAAVLRTWMNGWCTQGRFQGKAGCMWGCPHGEDDTRHYASCTRLAAAADAVLNLPPIRDLSHRAEDFLLLRPGAQDPREVVFTKALRLTAAYRLHCRWRLDRATWARLPPNGRMEAFRQAIFDLRRGPGRLSNVMAENFAD